MKRGLMTLALIGSTFIGSMALAQAEGDRGNRGDRTERGDRGDRQRRDPAQMRQAMLDRLKEQLKPTEEEWQVLQPMIEKVTNAQREVRAWGGGFGRGGDRGRGGDQAENAVQRASRELREAVQNDSANEAAIQEKLAAYRAARDKAEADLDAARKELAEVLTPRQEAVLVTMGMLE